MSYRVRCGDLYLGRDTHEGVPKTDTRDFRTKSAATEAIASCNEWWQANAWVEPTEEPGRWLVKDLSPESGQLRYMDRDQWHKTVREARPFTDRDEAVGELKEARLMFAEGRRKKIKLIRLVPRKAKVAPGASPGVSMNLDFNQASLSASAADVLWHCRCGVVASTHDLMGDHIRSCRSRGDYTHYTGIKPGPVGEGSNGPDVCEPTPPRHHSTEAMVAIDRAIEYAAREGKARDGAGDFQRGWEKCARVMAKVLIDERDGLARAPVATREESRWATCGNRSLNGTRCQLPAGHEIHSARDGGLVWRGEPVRRSPPLFTEAQVREAMVRALAEYSLRRMREPSGSISVAGLNLINDIRDGRFSILAKEGA